MSIDAVIRDLDPAAHVPDDLGHSATADAVLARVRQDTSLTTNPDRGLSTRDRRRSTPRSTARWLTSAAAIAAGVVALSTLQGGQDAYATWTAYPTGIAVQPDSPGGTWCTQWWGTDTTAQAAQVQPVLTEVRGDHTLVVGRGEDGVNALCLARTDSTDPEASGGTQIWTAAGNGTVDAGSLSLTAYSTQSQADRDPSPDDVEPAFSTVTGQVGQDVASVVVNTPQRGPVQASVLDGTFAAWWPWDKAWADPAYPELTFDLELTDGTVLESIPLTQIDSRPNT